MIILSALYALCLGGAIYLTRKNQHNALQEKEEEKI